MTTKPNGFRDVCLRGGHVADIEEITERRCFFVSTHGNECGDVRWVAPEPHRTAILDRIRWAMNTGPKALERETRAILAEDAKQEGGGK